MYKLKLTRREKKELALGKWIISGMAVLSLVGVVWLAWIRPAQHAASITNYQECQEAGYPIQTSYPEVCMTPDGKRFVNPEQDAAHKASLTGDSEPVMPSDPSLLYLDIEEWKVRLPLTEQTFDLMYSYTEDGLGNYVRLTYKRLVNAGICPGDVGVTVTKSGLKREPPYTADNPAPVAQVDNTYYYVAYAGSPCYDTDKPDHVTAVKAIAGDQSLTQVTGALFANLKPIPGE